MADLPLNAIDLGVGLILLISAILAFSRGFVHEVMSVAGWIGATFATIYGLPLLRPHAHRYIPIDFVAELTAGVLIFIISLVILSMMTRSVSRKIQDSALNALDRSLGFLFGLARGAVLICLVFIVSNWIWPLDGKTTKGDKIKETEQPAWVLASRSLPLIKQGSERLAELVPQEEITFGNEKTNELMRKNLDTLDTLRKMTSPGSKAPDTTAPDGYDPKARRFMDKAIETVK